LPNRETEDRTIAEETCYGGGRMCKRNYTNDKLSKCKRNTNLFRFKRLKKKNVLKELHECYDLLNLDYVTEIELI